MSMQMPNSTQQRAASATQSSPEASQDFARHYAVVPAAGTGARFGAAIPKQYLPVAGRPLIFHALAALCRHPRIERVWVVLAPGDSWWGEYDWQALGAKLETVYCGGETRAESVLNGLRAAETAVADNDWVMVHDAARPCLTPRLIDDLIDLLADDPVGGILAVPVADTIKRADPEGRVASTERREHLWQAQTPQMFRAGVLRRALESANAVTDEAGAIEALGLRPKLVPSDTHNFKVTYPADLRMAEQILMERL
jgi:2-C-methyl-D-erythritol 4-phosphate cytidylyltransferase